MNSYATRMRLSPTKALLGLALIFVAIAYFGPLFDMLLRSLGGGWELYEQVLTGKVTQKVLIHTLVFAAKVTLICLIVAYPLAVFAAETSPRWARLIILASTIPIWSGLLVRTFAWNSLLGRNGAINWLLDNLGLISEPLRLKGNSFGATVSSVYIMLPFMILTLYAGLAGIDRRLLSAARSLGASRGQSFLSVYMPLSVPAAVSASLLVFILSVGFFVTPALLGGPSDQTFSMLIEQRVNVKGDFETAAAMAVMLLGVTVIILAIFGSVVGFDQFIGRASEMRLVRRTGGVTLARLIGKTGPLLRLLEARWFWRLVAIAVIGFLLLPLAMVFPMSLSDSKYIRFPVESFSFDWYSTVLSGGVWMEAIKTSLIVGAIAAVIAVVAGLAGSIGLRNVGPRTGRIALVVFIIPAVLPVVVYAVGTFFSAGRFGLLDTPIAIAIAHAALALPFVVIIVSTGLGSLDSDLEMAARSLGATPLKAIRTITLPLIVPALLTGAAVAFLTSFDEVVVAIFLSGVDTATLPKEMWDSATLEVSPAIMAVGALVIVGICAIAACFAGLAEVVGRVRRRRHAELARALISD